MLYQLSYASEQEPEPRFRLNPASHTNPFRFNGTIIEVNIGVSEAQGRGTFTGGMGQRLFCPASGGRGFSPDKVVTVWRGRPSPARLPVITFLLAFAQWPNCSK